MARIIFIFALIVFLIACTPNATLAPLPTVTSSPKVIITPTSAATEVPSIANPISPENMDLLTKAGYLWDTKTGELKMENGYIALSYQNGKWVDTRTGAETDVEPKLVEVNGVGFDGKDIIVILTREVNGEKLMYNPTIDAWVPPLDVAASQRVIDRPDLPKSERGKWRDYEIVDLNNLPEMTWDDYHSGRLFYSEMLALKPWPENVRVPKLQYMRLSMGTNVWVLSEYPNLNFDEIDSASVRPILFENDGVQNLDAFRMKDPITGEWMIVKGQQYLYDGSSVVLHVFFGGKYANTNSLNGDHSIVQRSLVNPPELITQPIVNIKNDGSDYCGEGGLGEGYADQAMVCALLGYDDLELPRIVLPNKLQQMIAVFDTGVQLMTVATETYPVGDEIFKLQQLPMPQNSFFERHLDAYLLSEEDPLLDEYYPNP